MGKPVPDDMLPDSLASKAVPDDMLPDDLRAPAPQSRRGAGVLSAALQGGLAGLGDEAVGAFGATAETLTGDIGNKSWADRYGEIRDTARKDFEGYRGESPWQSFGVTAAGAIPAALLTRGKSVDGGLVSRMAAGAKTGSLWGGAAGFGSGEGDILEGEGGRIEGLLTGVATGGALGAVADAASPHIINAVKWVAGRVPSIFTSQGSLTEQAKAGLKTLGIDADEIGSDVLSQIKRDMGESVGARAQSAIDPREMATNVRLREAQTLPVPVPQTRGMVTQDPSQQMFENQARQGGYGPVAQGLLKTATGQSQDALRANVPAIQGRLSGGKPQVTEVGQGGEMVANRLQGMYGEAKAATDAAYDAARAGSSAGVPAGNVARGANEMSMRLIQEGFSPGSAPRVHGVLNELESYRALSGDKDFFPFVRTIFGARTGLTRLSQSSDKVEAKAAGEAVKYFDEWANGLLDKALVSGNKKAVEEFQTAIGKRRDLGRAFESNDLVHSLTEMDYRSGARTFAVAPEDAANVILGRANIPNLSRQNIARDLNRLKTMLGENSPEWDALREEVFLRFAQVGLQGQRKGEETLFSGANLARAWDNANVKARPVMGVLFSPEEKTIISQYARVAQRTMSPVEGGAPLGSGMSNIQILRNLGALSFAGPKVQALLNALPGVGKALATVVATPRAMRAVTPKAVRSQTRHPGLARGAASGVVPTQQ